METPVKIAELDNISGICYSQIVGIYTLSPGSVCLKFSFSYRYNKCIVFSFVSCLEMFSFFVKFSYCVSQY